MRNSPPTSPDPEYLPEPEAQRLLARASELDAARRAGAAVPDLRAAAAEAGISARAFDAALAELHDVEQARLPDAREQSRRRSRIWRLGVVGAALVAGVALAVTRSRHATQPARRSAMVEEIVEEAILLRCLSAGEAAELVRPLLLLPSNSVVIAPATAPRVLTIQATPEQLQQVQSVLAKYEGAGAPACATPPAATP